MYFCLGWAVGRGSLSSTWPEILKCSVPVICPIHPVAFGGKPADWGDLVKLTDFIFLRKVGKAVHVTALRRGICEKAR